LEKAAPYLPSGNDYIMRGTNLFNEVITKN
jgi:hypothetical protein